MGNNILSGSNFTGWIADINTKDIVGAVNNSNEATFCVPGIYNWTVPTGVTSINAVLIGGGANGNGTTNGGAGGELCYFNGLTVTPSSTLKISVGNGGDATSAWGEPSVVFDKSIAVTNANFNVITPGYTDYTSSSSWAPSVTTSFSYSAVLISGGGSGGAGAGAQQGGGGGAGGTTAWINNFYPFDKTGGLTVTVGQGGAGVIGANGNSGGTSEIIYTTDSSKIVSVPGGGGGATTLSGGGGGLTTNPTGATSYFLGGVGGSGPGAGGGGGGSGSFVAAGGAGGAGKSAGSTGNGSAGTTVTAGGAGGGGGGAAYTTSLAWAGGGGAGVTLTFSSSAATGGTAGTYTTSNIFAGGGQGSAAGSGAGASGSGFGGAYGGGSGGSPGGYPSGKGGNGAIRIIWPGVTRAFPPATSTASATPSYTTVTYWITVNSATPLNLLAGMPIIFDQAIGPLSANTIYTVTTASANFSNASTFYYFQIADSRGRTATLPAATNIPTANVNIYYPSNIARGGGSTFSSIKGGVTGIFGSNIGGTTTAAGGGGAGGYTGVGGNSGVAGAGGGGGGGNSTGITGGGGVGLYGTTASPSNGIIGGGGGSGGYNSLGSNGGLFGGGGGVSGAGAGGAVRIIWGSNTFPLNAATSNTTLPAGTVTIASTLNGSPILATNSSIASSSNISNGIVTLNNNPTSLGQAQFTIGAPTATIDTLNLNTNKGGTATSNSISIPPKPTNYNYINTPVVTNNAGLIIAPKNSNYNVIKLDVTGKDLSSKLALITQPRSDSGGSARKTDQNLSTQDDVLNNIGWIGGTST